MKVLIWRVMRRIKSSASSKMADSVLKAGKRTTSLGSTPCCFQSDSQHDGGEKTKTNLCRYGASSGACPNFQRIGMRQVKRINSPSSEGDSVFSQPSHKNTISAGSMLRPRNFKSRKVMRLSKKINDREKGFRRIEPRSRKKIKSCRRTET